MSSRLVQSATVEHTRYGAWIVDYTMTSAGAPQWDRVAEENFHQELAIELNGVVYSAPLIQPAQSSFSSFKGEGEISGNLTKADATRLANALTTYALEGRLTKVEEPPRTSGSRRADRSLSAKP
jgi:preprotein translocase subunit SecD